VGGGPLVKALQKKLIALCKPGGGGVLGLPVEVPILTRGRRMRGTLFSVGGGRGIFGQTIQKKRPWPTEDEGGFGKVEDKNAPGHHEEFIGQSKPRQNKEDNRLGEM